MKRHQHGPGRPATHEPHKSPSHLLSEMMQGAGLAKRPNYFGFKLPPYITKKKGKTK